MGIIRGGGFRLDHGEIEYVYQGMGIFSIGGGEGGDRRGTLTIEKNKNK